MNLDIGTFGVLVRKVRLEWNISLGRGRNKGAKIGGQLPENSVNIYTWLTSKQWRFLGLGGKCESDSAMPGGSRL